MSIPTTTRCGRGGNLLLPFLATARQAKRSAFLFSANIQKTVDKHTFFCYNNKAFADMAQQVEHILGKDEVTGSNPVISSGKKHLRKQVFFCCLLFQIIHGIYARVFARFAIVYADFKMQMCARIRF